MAHSIPFLIHQTWRGPKVPEKWKELQKSWLRHHPNWEYRLWTDSDLRQLVREHYPWFLAIYDHYPEKIQRVDAARYFLMHRYGGLYVDLDFECLRNCEELLRDRELVVGLEPDAHLSKPVVISEGLDRVVGNAFLASKPEHPFWEHLFLELVGAHRLPGPLESTGPFLLTRALRSFVSAASVTCVRAELLYPGTSDEADQGLLRYPAWLERNAKEAYAIHHWSGSWFEKESSASKRFTIPLTVISRGKPAVEGEFIFEKTKVPDEFLPWVSCLMVTRSSRLDFAKRAVLCFQAQTYPRKKLVVVDDGEDEALGRYLERLEDPSITWVRQAPGGAALGALRNLAVLSASGEYVMQWDDDDLYHPKRIEAQLAALRSTGADACLLTRWRIWWPNQKRLAVSKRRAWEGSLLCVKERMPRYDESLKRGEDTPVVLRLASSGKVALIDAPWLYTYSVHGDNTTPEALLEEQWEQATEFYWGKNYGNSMRALASELPEALQGDLLAGCDFQETEENARGYFLQQNSQAIRRTGSLPGSEQRPKLLILSPVKDGRSLIQNYVENLHALDYPADRIALALLESDSVDGTHEALSGRLEELWQRFRRVDLFKRDYGFRVPGRRSDAEVQLQRRSILARSRNLLLSRALRDEEWVLWLDFDVIEYPRDVISQLLSKGKEVIVPHCVLAPGGRTFDLNTFVKTQSEEVPGMQDSLFQPPRGVGRKYLEDLRDRDLVEVDGVGGTMLLVKADLHREGLIFPTAPYKGYIETEGLAFLARDMGVRCWGVPNLEVVHANR